MSYACACWGVPVATIGKVGVPSVSGGYSTADTFTVDRNDSTEDVRKMCLCVMSVFRRHTDPTQPPKFTEAKATS